MIKDFLIYIPLGSLILILVSFLFTLPMNDVLKQAKSNLNKTNNKPMGLMMLTMYILGITFGYYLLKIVSIIFIYPISIHSFWLLPSPLSFPISVPLLMFIFLLVPVGIYLYKRRVTEKKVDDIYYKTDNYEPDKKKYLSSITEAMGNIIIFSTILGMSIFILLNTETSHVNNYVEFNLITEEISDNNNENKENSTSITLKTTVESSLLILVLFFHIACVFLTSGNIYCYGVLCNFSKFNIKLKNNKSILCFLIAENEGYYIIKQPYKSVELIPKEEVQSLQFRN
ncbi:hypothetical protein KDN24_05620 [Bacillus sp. Bva_UNVM-123]|uniref:hypothetical protein n=1 Tax=Bacillus sp. Bva_UNVM-123 TaxID=2829798 RepID=UPI00391F23D9